MPLILSIDTATEACSVTLSNNEEILAHKEELIDKSHSSVITLFIEEVMKDGNRTLASLDAVAVGEGPGSYTGLRIGASTAKGICFALQKPLIAISNLVAMAHGLFHSFIEGKLHIENLSKEEINKILLCPMIDARRMEVYTALFDASLNIVKETAPVILSEQTYAEWLDKQSIIFFGSGSLKCKELYEQHRNAFFVDNFQSSSGDIFRLANIKFAEKSFEDVAYFEPNYLKEYFINKKETK